MDFHSRFRSSSASPKILGQELRINGDTLYDYKKSHDRDALIKLWSHLLSRKVTNRVATCFQITFSAFEARSSILWWSQRPEWPFCSSAMVSTSPSRLSIQRLTGMRTQDQGVMGSLLTVCLTPINIASDFVYRLTNSR